MDLSYVSSFRSLVAIHDVEPYNFTFANASLVLVSVVLQDGCPMNENIFSRFVATDVIVSVLDVKPINGTAPSLISVISLVDKVLFRLLKVSWDLSVLSNGAAVSCLLAQYGLDGADLLHVMFLQPLQPTRQVSELVVLR